MAHHFRQNLEDMLFPSLPRWPATSQTGSVSTEPRAKAWSWVPGSPMEKVTWARYKPVFWDLGTICYPSITYSILSTEIKSPSICMVGLSNFISCASQLGSQCCWHTDLLSIPRTGQIFFPHSRTWKLWLPILTRLIPCHPWNLTFPNYPISSRFPPIHNLCLST